MTSKTFKVAHLAALLAVNTTKSAYTCAQLAIDLTSIGGSVSDIATFQCNGFKNDRQDEYLNSLSRTDTAAANTYSDKIQADGLAYYEKRMAALEKKLAKLLLGSGLHIQTAGLSGLVWTMPNSGEYYI